MLKFLGIILRNKKATAGMLIVLTYIGIALAAPLLTSHDPVKRVGRPHQEPSVEHVMGTTRMGRDVYTQFIWGTQTSLIVGFSAGLIVTVLGTLIGVTAGYFGGWIDESAKLHHQHRSGDTPITLTAGARRLHWAIGPLYHRLNHRLNVLGMGRTGHPCANPDFKKTRFY